MTVQERNKATFGKLIDDVINGGHLELAEQLLTADRPDYQQGMLPAELLRGHEGFRRVIGLLREAFPDLHFTSEYMIAEGDRVLSYNTISGTHRGAFMGIPPTGKRFQATAADICSFDEDGKISAHWGVFDMLAVLVQLGVVAMPGRAS